MNRFALPKELQPTEADKKAQQRKEIIKALEAWKLFFKVVFFGLLLYYSGFLTHKYMNSGLLIPEVITSEIQLVKNSLKGKK